MHLLLTDRLTCPRCGPSFGLILLTTRLQDRVVYEGKLGCPNCRDSFPVEAGFGDLRAPPRGKLTVGLVGRPEDLTEDPTAAEAAQRLVALLGVVGGPGTVALVGEPARFAGESASAMPEIQVVGVDPDLRHWAEEPRVSRVVSLPGLPFFDSVLRAVAVDHRLGPSWVGEAARVVAPKGRVVVTRAGRGAAAELERAGLRVLAAEGETAVAVRG